MVKAAPCLVSLSTILLSATPATAKEPSLQELAVALGRHDAAPGSNLTMVDVADLRAVRCTQIEEEPTEFVCHWQQRRDHIWRNYSTWLAIDGAGWSLIDEPHLAPDLPPAKRP